MCAYIKNLHAVPDGGALAAKVTVYTLHWKMQFMCKTIQPLIMRVTHSGMICL